MEIKGNLAPCRAPSSWVRKKRLAKAERARTAVALCVFWRLLIGVDGRRRNE